MTNTPPGSENAPAPIGRKISPRFILRCFRDLALVVGALHLVTVFFFQPVRVEGNSMQPTIRDQERIFISKLSYRFSDIQRGDVVVFRSPENTDKTYIKRVVALPGETLRIHDGQVFINGRPIPEPYLKPGFLDREDTNELTVPPTAYFVLGDHREMSNDSRNWGPVPRDLIIGKAVLKYWPPSDFGFVR